MIFKSIATAVIVCALALPAQAADVRHPQTGDPAFTIRVPDGWQPAVDPRGDMRIVSPDKQVAITLTIRTSRIRRLDLSAITNAPHNEVSRKEITVSGYRGMTFLWTSGRDDKMLTVQSAAVMLDDEHVAICHVIMSPSITPPLRAAAEAAMNSLTVTPRP